MATVGLSDGALLRPAVLGRRGPRVRGGSAPARCRDLLRGRAERGLRVRAGGTGRACGGAAARPVAPPGDGRSRRAATSRSRPRTWSWETSSSSPRATGSRADLALESVHALAVDTSALTGESVPHHPDAGETVFAGCFVVEGEARSLVTATGSDTRLASIAELTHAQQSSPTPLAPRARPASLACSRRSPSASGSAFFLSSLLVGTKASDGFLFAVGVTVAVVPEGLLPTVTLSLAIGAQRMAARHALVRHLEAVETLGSTTFICHRQDRNADPQRDGGRRGVDAFGDDGRQGRGLHPGGRG